MFEHYLGAEKFRRGVSSYLSAHADGSGSTDDLLHALSKEAGFDVVAPFHTFLDQAGLPLVQAEVSCADTSMLTLKQSRFLPLGSEAKQDRSWQIPVCFRLGKSGGGAGAQCVLLTQAQTSIEVPECPTWVMPNADGAGYYRWSMPGAELKKLQLGYSSLSTAERISLAESLTAGVSSGAITIADALDALDPIARDEDGEVAIEAIPILYLVRDRLLPENQHAQLNRYAIALFGPAAKRLGYAAKKGESIGSRRLRAAVLKLLAWAEDPAAVKKLSALGLDYAGLGKKYHDGKFHPDAIDADLADIALAVAVEHGDLALFEALEKRLAETDDAALREQVITALSSVRDRARIDRVLALTLSDRLRKSEILWGPLYLLSLDPRTRDDSWAFVKAHYDALVPRLPEAFAVAILPWVARGYCDEAHAADATAFFAPRAEKVPGMPKNSRQAVEGIRLCAAMAAAQSESARAFFDARP